MSSHTLCSMPTERTPDDVIQDLRALAHYLYTFTSGVETCDEAAAIIEAQATEIERQRTHLQSALTIIEFETNVTCSKLRQIWLPTASL